MLIGRATIIRRIDATATVTLRVTATATVQATALILNYEVMRVTAAEGLTAGSFVSITATGVMMARADDYTLPADGYVKQAYNIGEVAIVYPIGTVNNVLSGLTKGSEYYLGDTPATITSDVSAFATDYIIQKLGRAISTTELAVENLNYIILA